ncbi:hypothetical protein PRIPAC_91737, partial [Pristionchus pacificus]
PVNATVEDVLAKNDGLVQAMKRMEMEHEETMKELLESNGDLSRRVGELELRNTELFERCKRFNKNRTTNVEHNKEKRMLEQQIVEIKNMYDLKEKSMIDQMNELRSRNTEDRTKLEQTTYELKSVTERNCELKRANAALLVDLETANGQMRKLNNEMRTFMDHTSAVHAQMRNVISQRDEVSRLLAISHETIAVAESKAAKAKDEIQRIAAIYRNEIIHMKAAKNSSEVSPGNLSDHCACNICCEEYDSVLYVPRMLRCGHTFCGRCCNELRNNDTIKCPTCKAVCEYAMSEQPPVNYYAIGVSEGTLKSVQKAKCETCDKVKSEQTIKENEETEIAA